jgi:cystathionine beta-lyase family protein involved in aluminum resistance
LLVLRWCFSILKLHKQYNLKQAASKAEDLVFPIFKEITATTVQNLARLLDAFRTHHVTEAHLHSSTGYGYDDMGLTTLENVFATYMGADAALIRPNFISGTHAITVALFSCLHPGDHFLYITGEPYDTLLPVLGINKSHPDSLAAWNISGEIVPLSNNGCFNLKEIKGKLKPNTKLICIQRSSGYSTHPSRSMQNIAYAIKSLRSLRKDLLFFVDNCYGEFVETSEPSQHGADLIAGSLIKNPGGGLAKSGGYIAGKSNLILRAAERLTAPGLGKHGGASYGYLRDFWQGLFLAPSVVGEALKGAVFTAALLSSLGFKTTPCWSDKRTDIIQKISFADAATLLKFCEQIQAFSPIDAHITPIPAPMPGYQDKIIMAAGTFVQGSSIELTADAPLRKPYTLFMQGGLSYAHVKIAITKTLEVMLKYE